MKQIDRIGAALLKGFEIGGGQRVMLDAYNQAATKDIAVTVTTRIAGCNHYWIMETYGIETNANR